MLSKAFFAVVVPAPDDPVMATIGCFFDIHYPYMRQENDKCFNYLFSGKFY